jgi:hypothetical protein
MTDTTTTTSATACLVPDGCPDPDTGMPCNNCWEHQQDQADAETMGFGPAWTPSQLPGRTEDQMVLDIFHHASVAREGYAGGTL